MAKFYRVGGSVRDEFLGLKSKDIDFSVESESFDAMRQAVINRGGEIFIEKPEFLTIRGRLPEIGAADFVLCRKEGEYSDGRRPDHVEAGTIFDDLARRDFTVNAIAKDEDTGEIIDPHQGQRDIKIMLLKCVGKTEDRFEEDSLRMLRAIRFSITKGFKLSVHIESALKSEHFHKLLSNVSIERVREELFKCFKHDTLKTLELLRKTKLDKVVFAGELKLEPTLKQ